MHYYGDESNVNEVPDFEVIYARNRKVIENFGIKQKSPEFRAFYMRI